MAGRVQQSGASLLLAIFAITALLIPAWLIIAPFGSAGSLALLTGVACLALWLSTRMLNGPERSSPRALRVAAAAFGVAAVLSYASAMARPIASDEVSPADFKLVLVGAWLGVLFLAMDGLKNKAELLALVRILAFSGGVVAAVGIAQFATREALVDRFTLPGLVSAIDQFQYVRQGFTRPSGTAVHPIEFGVVLSMLLPFAIYVGTSDYVLPRLPRWVPTGLIAAVIPLSLSRSTLIGSAVAIGCMLPALTSRAKIVTLTLLAGVLIASAIAVPGLVGSLRGMFISIKGDPSIQSRTDSYDLALEMFSNSPLLGRGLGTLLPRYRIFDNEVLSLLVSVGVLGLIAFAAILVVSFGAVRRTLRVHDVQPEETILLRALLASLIVGYVSLLLFDTLSFQMTSFLIFFVAGLIGACVRLVSERHRGGRRLGIWENTSTTNAT